MRLKLKMEKNVDNMGVEKPKKTKKRFTKRDLDNAFYAGRARRFDTGVELNPNFELWYKRYTKKN